jgi:hypothetical protein
VSGFVAFAGGVAVLGAPHLMLWASREGWCAGVLATLVDGRLIGRPLDPSGVHAGQMVCQPTSQLINHITAQSSFVSSQLVCLCVLWCGRVYRGPV